MTQRTTGWEDRLAETLAEWRERPFEWGRSDCLLFCAASAEALTERDYSSGYLERYADARGAWRAIQRRTIEQHLDRLFKRRSPSFARRGDLALIKDEEDRLFGGAAGVVDMSGRNVLALSEKGLLKAPIPAYVWSVG